MTPTNPLDFHGSDEAGTAAGFVVPATVRQTAPTSRSDASDSDGAGYFVAQGEAARAEAA